MVRSRDWSVVRSYDWSMVWSRDWGVVRSCGWSMVWSHDWSVAWSHDWSVVGSYDWNVVWSRDWDVVRSCGWSVVWLWDWRVWFGREEWELSLENGKGICKLAWELQLYRMIEASSSLLNREVTLPCFCFRKIWKPWDLESGWEVGKEAGLF